jgi:hypothetical protein
MRPDLTRLRQSFPGAVVSAYEPGYESVRVLFRCHPRAAARARRCPAAPLPARAPLLGPAAARPRRCPAPPLPARAAARPCWWLPCCWPPWPARMHVPVAAGRG